MYATIAIIITNFIVFSFELIMPKKIIYLLGFSPARFYNQPWTIITSMFVHGGFDHIFANMLTLFFFGIPLERMIGSKKFLLVYFVSGIFGNLLYYLLYFGKDIFGIGASGAIFGVLGAFAVMRPGDYVIMFPVMIPIPLALALVLWFLINLIGLIFQLGNIGYAAHLGGLIVGVLFGKKFKKKIIPYEMEEYLNSFEF
jgi:membrane associated rhomboid family serine protease